MSYRLCRHIKTNGLQCHSPALDDGLWCYFHHRLHGRHKRYRTTEATRGYLIPGQHVELTALEDRESVQVALSVVINALASGNLDIKRATALLYGLQLASNNARGLRTEPFAANIVRTVEPSPEGLDLAEPGAVYEVEDTPATPLLWEGFEDDNEEDDEDNEEEFTEEQTKRFLEIYPAKPSREQPQQDHSNPEISVEQGVQEGMQESASTNRCQAIGVIGEDRC